MADDSQRDSPAQASGHEGPAQASGHEGPAQASGHEGPAQASGHDTDREWTHDPLERSFFSTIGKGYLIGIVIFGLFGFGIARTQASEWGVGAAIGMGAFVAVFAGILGGVVLIGLWAVKNEELIRGNETGHEHLGEAAPPGATPNEDGAAPEGAGPGDTEDAAVDVAAAEAIPAEVGHDAGQDAPT